MNNKVTKFHIAHSYHSVEMNDDVACTFQVYSVGIYIVVACKKVGNISQGSTTPNRIKKLEAQLRKDFESGIITNLKFTKLIGVRKVNGLYEQIEV